MMSCRQPIEQRAPRGAARAGLLAQGLRFLLVGSTGTVAYLVLYLLLTTVFTDLAANAIAWLITTVATNSAHRHVTYGVRSAMGSDEVVGLVTSLAALGLTTWALALLGGSSGVAGAVALVVVNTAVGTVRFFVMRRWFAGRADVTT